MLWSFQSGGVVVISILEWCGHFNPGMLWPFQFGDPVVIPIREIHFQATMRHQKNMIAGDQFVNCSAFLGVLNPRLLWPLRPRVLWPLQPGVL